MSFPLAGVAAPALTGLLYAIIGLAGIVLIDLLTFLAAVLAVVAIHIPAPTRTAEGQRSSGDLWREWLGGLRYLRLHPALLTLVLYFTAMNFLLNGPLELSIPYLMTVTASETTTGIVLALNSLGGVVGAGLLAVWGGTRPRIHTIMPAMLLVGAMFLLYGTTRAPLLLAVAIFVLIAALQVWALYTSILQAKTPPDMQGRVFALVAQLGYLGATTSFLLTSGLADGVFPLERMSAILVGAGVLILLLTAGVYALPAVRHLERDLPSYTGAEA
jgi:hypothetical protein